MDRLDKLLMIKLAYTVNLQAMQQGLAGVPMDSRVYGFMNETAERLRKFKGGYAPYDNKNKKRPGLQNITTTKLPTTQMAKAPGFNEVPGEFDEIEVLR